MRENSITSQLKKEAEKLHEIVKGANAELINAPEGTVHIRKHKNGYQFYHKSDSDNKNEVYIPAKERKKAYALVRKHYLEKIVCAAKEQLNAIDGFLKKYDPDALYNVFLKTSSVRQKMIAPIVIPDEEMIKDWQSREYIHKKFAEDEPEHFTLKNERVRSKSEVMIADALFRKGIPYHYEYPISINGRELHPDFTILRIYDRKEIIWEHLGKMDDPDYMYRAVSRIREFEAAGFFVGDNLIITMETLRMPLNQAVINRTIQHYL